MVSAKRGDIEMLLQKVVIGPKMGGLHAMMEEATRTGSFFMIMLTREDTLLPLIAIKHSQYVHLDG